MGHEAGASGDSQKAQQEDEQLSQPQRGTPLTEGHPACTLLPLGDEFLQVFGAIFGGRLLILGFVNLVSPYDLLRFQVHQHNADFDSTGTLSFRIAR